MKSKIPPQFKDNEIASFASLKTGLTYGFYGFMGVSLVLSCFLSALLSFALQLLTSLTTLTIYGLLAVPSSGTLQVITMFIFEYTQFQLIDMDKINEKLFTWGSEEDNNEMPEKPLNDYFGLQGFKSLNFIINVGTTMLYLCAYVAAYLLFFIVVYPLSFHFNA